MYCDSLHVKLLTQSRLITLLPSFLLHAGWSCIRLSDGPNIKLVVFLPTLELFKLAGARLTLVCCLVIRCSTGFQRCYLTL